MRLTGNRVVLLFLLSLLGGISYNSCGQYAVIGQDPLKWSAEPHSIFSSEVRMSVEIPDIRGQLEYRFECVGGAGYSSEWQLSNEFKNSGLSPETRYSYIARVRKAGTDQEVIPATDIYEVTTRRSTNTGESRYIPEIDRAFANGEIELIPIRVTGDKDNRINFCAINRWEEGKANSYNTPELREEFINDARHAFRTFIPGDDYAIAPYPEYRDFFNLYAIWWPGMPAYDWEKGLTTVDLDEIRDRLFLPWNREGRGWVSCLAMLNTDGGGGGAARNIETRTGNAMIAGRETEGFIHEFAHTAPGLPDEYTSNGVWGKGGEGSNTTLDYNLEDVKWRAWIEPGTEIPTPYSRENLNKIGVFEGATHRLHHIYRPTARGCIMGAGSFAGDPDGLCPVCIQRTVCRLYMWVDPFDAAYPARKELCVSIPGKVHFSVNKIDNLQGSQKLCWLLNGKVIAENVAEIDITFDRQEEYRVECQLLDQTEFVRPDLPYVDYPKATVSWVINRDSDQSNLLKSEIASTEKRISYSFTKPEPEIPGFYLQNLEFKEGGKGTVRIANPNKEYIYYWFEDDFPDYVPKFPNGKFYGSGVKPNGDTFKAVATVVENKGGIFIKDTAKNDFGSWIYLKLYPNGEYELPVEFEIPTSQDGRFAKELLIKDHKTDKITYDDNFRFSTENVDITWNGIIRDGAIELNENGYLDSSIKMYYSSAYDNKKEALGEGIEFKPDQAGNYYVEAADQKTGARSLNRIGVAIAEKAKLNTTNAILPDQIEGSDLLMWLDGNDLDADGKPDGNLFRRGSANGGKSKAGNLNFHFFNYFPNKQNGKPVLSWSTIWVQGLSHAVNKYQTLIIVRKESDLSSPGTAPWRELDKLIGIGNYGEKLFADDISSSILEGNVWINGDKIDPKSALMPKDFYIAIYEFPEVMDNPFKITDGHWEGDVCEVLVYDSKLSEENRKGVETYLFKKWISGVSHELSETSGGLHGYIHYSTTDHPEGFRAGISFYTAVWPLIDKPLANFQIGLPSAWVAPENSDVDFPLCPQGTYARDHWDERGPTYSSVFQTIEGGVGYWQGNKFRYNSPKFSMNATSSCYDFEIASPGWSFFYSDTALADDKMGIAQLSNRILVPPDGLTFVGNPDGQFLGYSWMALPFLDAVEGPPPTGDQSWTLFLNTMNFKGPVAYYIAETWSKISKEYPPDYGRGLDARPAEMGGGAIEINTVPKIVAQGNSDTLYYKIPKMKFPVDENGKTVLVQDVKYYSKDALYNSFKSWRNGSGFCDGRFTDQGTWAPELFTKMPVFDQDRVVLENMEEIFRTEVFGDHIFGMQWFDNEVTSTGCFPQYYRQIGGGKRVPVSVDEVPAELAAKEFMLAGPGKPYTSPKKGSWVNPGPASEPETLTLADGSEVTYCWYRFIDQPSFQQFNWSREKKEKLQALVERIHTNWRIDSEYMAPPSTGTLVNLDPKLIVQPPAGMEVGYVPIVIGQK